VLTGGCFCGAVRYEADGEPFERAVCWCEICRRTTGGIAVAWFTVRPGELRFTQGAPTVYASSHEAERGFCPSCGTQLTFRRHDYGDRVDVATGSLDDVEAAPPVEQIWTTSRPRWAGDLSALPGNPTDSAHPLTDAAPA
jgi:hypothetical protein